jgi:3-hydroxyisobutyrate dehydrogenase-like beta-hydroxyacid dehydrogenase
MAAQIAVVGLGIMGSELAARLLDAGHPVRGFDIDPERMELFVAAGGTAATSPADAADGCGMVILSLLTSDIAREVCLGENGLTSSRSRPLLVLDSTTGWPDDTVEISGAMAAQGIDYCDMTVSGNAASARAGDLVVMFGGSEDAYRAATPVMEVLGRAHHHVGPVGSASRMKLIVNHILSVNRAVLGEGLVAAELGGLDLATTLEILQDSAAYSKAMDLWGPRMVAGDHDRPNARLRQSRKDALLIAEHARSLGASAPFIGAAESLLSEGVETGLGEADNSSVVEVLRRRAGIGRVPEPGRDET